MNEAVVALIVLLARPTTAEKQDRLTNFMNAVATAESIDTSRAEVYAQADPPVDSMAVSGRDQSIILHRRLRGRFARVGHLDRELQKG